MKSSSGKVNAQEMEATNSYAFFHKTIKIIMFMAVMTWTKKIIAITLQFVKKEYFHNDEIYKRSYACFFISAFHTIFTTKYRIQ